MMQGLPFVKSRAVVTARGRRSGGIAGGRGHEIGPGEGDGSGDTTLEKDPEYLR